MYHQRYDVLGDGCGLLIVSAFATQPWYDKRGKIVEFPRNSAVLPARDTRSCYRLGRIVRSSMGQLGTSWIYPCGTKSRVERESTRPAISQVLWLLLSEHPLSLSL